MAGVDGILELAKALHAELGPSVSLCMAKEDWENLLDNPSLGMMLFMQGKLKASNLAVATKLQNILG